MIILLLMLLIPAAIIYYCFIIGYKMYSGIKANGLLESISSKEDLIFMHYKDFVNVIAEVYARKGHKVKLTSKCGEDGNGLFLDDLIYIEAWKHSRTHEVEIETAMKLVSRMDRNSICRGILITLGDFKQNTRAYCYKNVIECINFDQLLAMCKEVQRRNMVSESY